MRTTSELTQIVPLPDQTSMVRFGVAMRDVQAGELLLITKIEGVERLHAIQPREPDAYDRLCELLPKANPHMVSDMITESVMGGAIHIPALQARIRTPPRVPRP